METLGSVTYICTDKTGTLTKNKMYMEDMCVGNKLFSRKTLNEGLKEEAGKLLLYSCAMNNDAVEYENNNLKGDSTEVALMEVAREHNISSKALPRITEIAFDSGRKLMTTFHTYNNRIISFTKGAPDIILERCENPDKTSVLEQVNQGAANGHRVLGFAYRYWDAVPLNPNSNGHETSLYFLGLAGIIDPPREEVFDAVKQCKAAGIIPVMIYRRSSTNC